MVFRPFKRYVIRTVRQCKEVGKGSAAVSVAGASIQRLHIRGRALYRSILPKRGSTLEMLIADPDVALRIHELRAPAVYSDSRYAFLNRNFDSAERLGSETLRAVMVTGVSPVTGLEGAV